MALFCFICTTPAVAEKPTSEQFLSLLLNSAKVQLTAKNVGCTHKTIGSYLAFLLATAADKDKRQNLITSITCHPMKGAEHWRCSYYINIRDIDSGDPWNYGITVLFQKGQKIIEPHQVRCPGTG